MYVTFGRLKASVFLAILLGVTGGCRHGVKDSTALEGNIENEASENASRIGLFHSLTNNSPSSWHSSVQSKKEIDSLREDYVFHSLLENRGTGQKWTIKVGKGGQIYSISTPELGELIAKQRAEAGQWVDEVFQHTIPMPPQKDTKGTSEVVDGDIHQAGMYSKSDFDGHPLIPHSIYSPIFNYRYIPHRNRVQYVTWPLHAHLPRFEFDRPEYRYVAKDYRQNQILMKQTITALNRGVLQIELEISKWGGAVYPMVTIPKATFRTSTLPVQLVSNPDGSFREEHRKMGPSSTSPSRMDHRSIGSWFAATDGNSADSRGIGVVFGYDTREFPGQIDWGTYFGASEDMRGTSLFVRRIINAMPGETIYARYFLVIGTVAEIQSAAKQLESSVEIRKFTRSHSEVTLQQICSSPNGLPTSACEIMGSQPLMRTYSDYFTNALPLFLIQDLQTGKHRVSKDPYTVSFDPSDGKTRYVDFLGWATADANDSENCPSILLQLGSLPNVEIDPAAANLKVFPAQAQCQKG